MKNKFKPSLLLLLLLPLQAMSQIYINGTVTEASGNIPVIYATVYVNGTSNGTITDSLGQFSLTKVIPPCKLVVSHISYATEIIELKQNADTVLQIKLNPRDVELGVIEVKDKNRREENLRHFKDRFLGTDYWGKHAYFENDSMLVFHRKSITESERYDNESLLLPADSSSTLFVVNTKGPLLVNLPLLGYKLHINLIHYTELQTGSDTDYEFHTLGYFYFQPEKDVSKRKTNRFQKKRLKAYYNSDRHFCRSLFRDRLKENGYIVRINPKHRINPKTGAYILYSNIINPETGEPEKNEFELDNHIIRTSDLVKIVGLKDKNYRIKYYEKNNAPIKLNKKEGLPSSTSQMFFLKDTCTIRADGSRPDNSIMFGPKIGNKRVGAMLPNDYEPGNKE